MRARIERRASSLGALVSVAAGAVVLWLICGVGFANYDTLYALAWGGQLSRGQTPTYDVAIAPTPPVMYILLPIMLSHWPVTASKYR